MFGRPRFALGAAFAALLTLGLSAEPSGRAQFIDSFTWQSDDPAFGGFSGLELNQDGTAFVAVSDRTHIAEGTIRRTDGIITGIDLGTIREITDRSGKPLKKGEGDSEGLAQAPDGNLLISFEGRNRVWRYRDGKPVELPRPREFSEMQPNGGLEALAIDSRGWIYTLPERSGTLTEDFPVYRFRDDVWDQPFSISRSDGFLAVGADFGPDGMFYLLERSFTGVNFLSRVRRFDMSASQIGPGEMLLQSGAGQFDNLEGLSVWRDAQGRIRLTMISDDNFRFFQRTQIVEFALPE